MTSTPSWQRVGVEETRNLLTDPDLLLFDVRDRKAYDSDHIQGALHLTQANLDKVLLTTPKDRPVLIYCYHGNASQTYAEMFRDFGFQIIRDLIGGYEAWRNETVISKAAKPLTAKLQAWLSTHGYPTTAVDTPGTNAMTPLMRACARGEAEIVAELLDCGASVSALNSDGNNALWLACFNGDAAIIERLLHAGIAIDHQNDNGATCLMYASSSGKHQVVAQLLKAGADSHLQSVDGFSALDMAATEDCLFLLRAEAKRGVI